jgi:hypothetical protein
MNTLLPFPMDEDSRPIRNCFFMNRCKNSKCKFNHDPIENFRITFPATTPGEKKVKCDMWTIYEEQKRIELRLKGASDEKEIEELRTNHTLKYINDHTLDELREGLLNLNLEKERLATEAGVLLEQLKYKYGNLYGLIGELRKLAKNKKKISATEVSQQPEKNTPSIDFTLPLTHEKNMNIIIDAFANVFGNECFNKLVEFSQVVADNYKNIVNQTILPNYNNEKLDSLALAVAQYMFQDDTEKKNSAQSAGISSIKIEEVTWADIMDDFDRLASANTSIKIIAKEVKPKPTSYKNAL